MCYNFLTEDGSMNAVINYIVQLLQNLGIVGGFLLVLLESAFPIMPLAIFIGLNCVSYGFIVGSVVSWCATVTGSILSFLLFKTIFKHKFYFLFKRNEKLKKKVENLITKMHDMDFNGLVILLAIPFTPAFAVNIAAGLSDMSFRKYFFALLISKISIVYFWGYVGTNFIESITDFNKLMQIVGIVFLAYFASKLLEKIVKID